jgi:hypothetical protein
MTSVGTVATSRDDEYKRAFLTPLIEDLHTTLIARNRYRYEPTKAR